MTSARVIFGEIITLVSDPFRQGRSALRHHERGALAVGPDGKIAWVGDQAELPFDYASWPQESAYGLIMPGFVDCHSHFPQYKVIASYGADLLEWLERYTFPEESKFGDTGYASDIAVKFVRAMLGHGVTTACVFSTIHAQAFAALMTASTQQGLHTISGITAMDRNAPEALHNPGKQFVDANQAAYKASQSHQRFGYAVTPRFAITSTAEQLEACGDFFARHPDTLMQTHINENQAEIAFTAELFPEAQDYLDVYDRFGLVNDRALFAHGIYGSEREFDRFAETKARVVSCPTSNTFLGSGLFKATNYSSPIGLGHDIGGGTSYSPFATMAEAYKVARFHGRSLTALETLYWHTLGGADVLHLSDQVGSLEAGKWADFIVIDPRFDEIAATRWAATDDIIDRLFALQFLLPERPGAIKQVVSSGIKRKG